MRRHIEIHTRAIVALCCLAGAGAGAAAGCGAEPDAPSLEEASSVRQELGESPVRFNFVKTADSGATFNARVDITNLGPNVIRGWEAGFDMPVNVNVHAALPAQNWFIFNTVGIENDVRITMADSSNVINV